jgi:hypothetical protein
MIKMNDENKKIETRDTDIKISIQNTPVGLSEWTNESVNQVILETNVIKTMINNLDRNGVTIRDVKKPDHEGCQPFLEVFVDGFVLYFSYHYSMTYAIRVEVETAAENQRIYHLDFYCKFCEPLKVLDSHRYSISTGYLRSVYRTEILPKDLMHIANKICEILPETVRTVECND